MPRSDRTHSRNHKLSYDDKFLIISSFVERWLVILAIGLFIGIAVVQGLYQIDYIRHAMVEVERLEGIRFTPE